MFFGRTGANRINLYINSSKLSLAGLNAIVQVKKNITINGRNYTTYVGINFYSMTGGYYNSTYNIYAYNNAT